MASSLEQRVRDGFQQRDTFGAVIDTMADALLVTDEHGAVDLVNPAAARLFDLDPTEAIGKTFIEIVRDHEIAEVLQKTLASGHAQTGEVGVRLRSAAAPSRRRHAYRAQGPPIGPGDYPGPHRDSKAGGDAP